ncbi:MAG: hypothetical protein SR1Q7_04725 [Quinella sp. 1Q7]|nr:hypothetical protein [Quinella sp. 1Q7]
MQKKFTSESAPPYAQNFSAVINVATVRNFSGNVTCSSVDDCAAPSEIFRAT